MKKIFKHIVLALALTSTLTSCDSWLDLEPANSMTREEFWQSKEDIESVIVSGYLKMCTNVSRFFYWGELRGGSLISGQSPVVDHTNIFNLEITEDNGQAKWGFAYTIINVANEVILYAPDVVERDPSLSQSKMHSLQAEAYFQRALSYFYLVRTFKDVPYVTIPSFDDTVDFYVPKVDGTSILESEVAALEQIVEYAPQSFDTEAQSKGRATKAAIYALMADIYLWLEKPAEAITACEGVYASATSTLVGANLWFDMFAKGLSNETIFEAQFNRSMGTANPIVSPLLFDAGKQLTVNPLLALDYESDDIRGEGGTFLMNNGAYEPWKVVGLSNDITNATLISEHRTTGSTDDSNYIFYRLADVKFMEAEARAMVGEFQTAKDLIFEVVSRSTSAFSTDGVADEEGAILSVILAERKKEFALEGKYWFDLLRIAKRNDWSNKALLTEVILSTATSTNQARIAAVLEDNNSLYLPIHSSELELNKSLVQNPFYKY